jgi:hypothetical protein
MDRMRQAKVILTMVIFSALMFLFLFILVEMDNAK